MRAPTYAYRIGEFILTRSGNLEVPDDTEYPVLLELYDTLVSAGYQPEEGRPQPRSVVDMQAVGTVVDGAGTEISLSPDANSDTPGFTVSLPADKVNLGNLKALLEAKGVLIKRALGVDDLPVREEDGKVSFPWFATVPDADAVRAYTYFISELCEMSMKQSRVTAKEKPVTNEKYEFRCFLLRLGFIGTEHKNDRKILLSRLSGNGSFKSGSRRVADSESESETTAASESTEGTETSALQNDGEMPEG